MIKGQQQFTQVKPFVIIPYIIAQDEIFLPVTEQAIPGVYPYYMISNYGRVFLKYGKTPFMSYVLDSKGYWYGKFATTDGGKICSLHRVEAMTFNYFPGCEEYLIDHVDGNRMNMRLINLEWVNYQENTRRAVAMSNANGGSLPPQIIPDYIQRDMLILKDMKDRLAIESSIRKQQEDNIVKDYTQKNFNDMKTQFNCQSNSTKNSGRETHSDEQIEQICFMLQQGYTMAYIANTLKVKKSYVAAVYHKQTGIQISQNYDFSNYGSIPYHDKWLFTTEQVNQICQYLQDNDMSTVQSKKQFIKQMFAILGIEYSDNRYRTVLDIYNGRGYKSVACNYNIKR